MRVLLVDDEEVILDSLAPVISSQGHEVVTATDGRTALATLSAGSFSLVLLDLGLPDIDGIELIAKCKELSDAAVIILSARHLEADKVRALDEGADD